jgi:hypothetical protein
MSALTALFNRVFFQFTLVVIGTDGAPRGVPYTALAALLLLVPVFTVFVFVRHWVGPARSGFPGGPGAPEGGVGQRKAMGIARAAAICNVALVVCVCLALVDQYPHPPEARFLAYAVLTLLTPILSAVVLLVGAGRAGERGAEMGAT